MGLASVAIETVVIRLLGFGLMLSTIKDKQSRLDTEDGFCGSAAEIKKNIHYIKVTMSKINK